MNLNTTFDATRRDYPPYKSSSTTTTISLSPVEEPRKLIIEDFLPTVDQLNYTIHCMQKQETKLSHALNQVYDTITKLEIMREYIKEKETK